ncbi:MAG: M28 family peptidase [Gemmatimonadota bacterium]
MILPLLALALTTQQIDTMALRAHTRFLSSDLLQGRGTGTLGERIAAQYIEAQLLEMGLHARSDSFSQSVPLKQAHIDAARLVVRAGPDSAVFSTTDFVINTGGERALRNFAGSAVFVGTVEHARAANDATLAGQVLVIAGTLGADAQLLVPRWLKAGVQAVILLIPDSAQFQLFSRSRGEARYFIASEVNEPIWQSALPMVLAGPRLLRALTPEIGALMSQLSRNGTMAPVALQRRIELSVQTTVRDLPTRNLIGFVPGSDPRLRGQYVIYTAHYDHLGISTPDARGDSIYNGFSDNAAGVAMLLAIAQDMKRSPPARSVAFLFLTGEERGLLGATYYVSNPVIPLDSTVAVINLDAGAPPAPPVEWRIAGGTSNALGAMAQRIGTRHGWKVDLSEPSPNSDYWSFHTHQVPAVFIVPGARWENTTDAQRDALRARWDRYHRADDEWSAQFPFSGLRRYAEFALELGRSAAAVTATNREAPGF